MTDPESGETTEEFARRLVEEVGVGDVGGFSLVFGRLGPFERDGEEARVEAERKAPGLAIVSNRSANANDLVWIAQRPGEVYGLSNSHYGDSTWPKVRNGESGLLEAITSHAQRKASKQALVEQLLELLSLDTMPRRKQGEKWETYLIQLRNSILIPRIGGEEVKGRKADVIAAAGESAVKQGGEEVEKVRVAGDGAYATQKQTVILVDRQGRITFVERTLFDEKGKALDNSREVFEFDIEEWGA